MMMSPAVVSGLVSAAFGPRLHCGKLLRNTRVWNDVVSAAFGPRLHCVLASSKVLVVLLSAD